MIIGVVQVGAVKIYVAAVEALRKKERGGQNRMKLNLPQEWFISELRDPTKANVHFCRFLKNLTRYQTKLRVLVLCFPGFTQNSITNIFCYIVIFFKPP